MANLERWIGNMEINFGRRHQTGLLLVKTLRLVPQQNLLKIAQRNYQHQYAQPMRICVNSEIVQGTVLRKTCFFVHYGIRHAGQLEH